MLKTTQKGSPPISTSQFSAYKEAGVEVTDVIPISDERVAPPQQVGLEETMAWAGVICPIETRYWTSE
jgi:hypothetical protein